MGLVGASAVYLQQVREEGPMKPWDKKESRNYVDWDKYKIERYRNMYADGSHGFFYPKHDNVFGTSSLCFLPFVVDIL